MSNVRRFGAAGDGTTDDTEAIAHTVAAGDGWLKFPRGEYLITRTIEIPLERYDRTAIDGLGGTAKVVMAGPGPAFRLVGTHSGTADPSSFEPNVWQRQRMPSVCNIEIEGRHAHASGIFLEGTMQPILEGILLRGLWDGIRLTGRNRNLVVSHCHIYQNRHIGIHFDHVNLHQAIISASHISYNPFAGICIQGSEIRNLQITGNDIEYNHSADVEGSADIAIDCSTQGSTVREATICSNTIQARYSPDGANVRVVGLDSQQDHKAGMLTITGNLIGSQQTNVHLKSCRGIVVTGNVIYSGHGRNLLIESSRNIVVGPNSFDHNPDYRDKEICTGIRIADTVDLQLTGCLIQDAKAGKTTVPSAKTFPRTGLVELVRSRRIGINGCQILDAAPHGIYAEDCSELLVSGSTITDDRAEKKLQSAIRWKGAGNSNLIAGCRIGRGTKAALDIDVDASVTLLANLVDE